MNFVKKIFCLLLIYAQHTPKIPPADIEKGFLELCTSTKYFFDSCKYIGGYEETLQIFDGIICKYLNDTFKKEQTARYKEDYTSKAKEYQEKNVSIDQFFTEMLDQYHQENITRFRKNNKAPKNIEKLEDAYNKARGNLVAVYLNLRLRIHIDAKDPASVAFVFFREIHSREEIDKITRDKKGGNMLSRMRKNPESVIDRLQETFDEERKKLENNLKNTRDSTLEEELKKFDDKYSIQDLSTTETLFYFLELFFVKDITPCEAQQRLSEIIHSPTKPAASDKNTSSHEITPSVNRPPAKPAIPTTSASSRSGSQHTNTKLGQCGQVVEPDSKCSQQKPGEDDPGSPDHPEPAEEGQYTNTKPGQLDQSNEPDSKCSQQKLGKDDPGSPDHPEPEPEEDLDSECKVVLSIEEIKEITELAKLAELMYRRIITEEEDTDSDSECKVLSIEEIKEQIKEGHCSSSPEEIKEITELTELMYCKKPMYRKTIAELRRQRCATQIFTYNV